MRRNSTLHDVAERAGVSPRTVSRVVNDEGGFGPDVRARVLQAIDELDYRPNLLARALITRRSATIGLVGGDLTDPFFAELAAAIQSVAEKHDRTLFFSGNLADPGRQGVVLESLRSHAVEGVILFPAEGSEADVQRIAVAGLPVVLVDRDFGGPRMGAVLSEIATGAQLAVEHLLAKGRERIAMTANVMSVTAALPPRREHGYRRALTLAGRTVDPGLMAHAEPTIEGGRAAVEELLSRRPDLDAVFAYNDLMAIGAIQALAAGGRQVPADVAVVGFNDTLICPALVPPLTSVRIDIERVATEAVDLLLRIASQPHAPHANVNVPVALVVRSSS